MSGKKRSRQPGTRRSDGHEITLRYLLTDEMVGGLIGRGGATILRLRKIVGSATVADKHDKNGRRMFTLCGSKKECRQGLQYIKDIETCNQLKNGFADVTVTSTIQNPQPTVIYTNLEFLYPTPSYISAQPSALAPPRPKQQTSTKLILSAAPKRPLPSTTTVSSSFDPNLHSVVINSSPNMSAASTNIAPSIPQSQNPSRKKTHPKKSAPSISDGVAKLKLASSQDFPSITQSLHTSQPNPNRSSRGHLPRSPRMLPSHTTPPDRLASYHDPPVSSSAVREESPASLRGDSPPGLYQLAPKPISKPDVFSNAHQSPFQLNFSVDFNLPAQLQTRGSSSSRGDSYDAISNNFHASSDGHQSSDAAIASLKAQIEHFRYENGLIRRQIEECDSHNYRRKIQKEFEEKINCDVGKVESDLEQLRDDVLYLQKMQEVHARSAACSKCRKNIARIALVPCGHIVCERCLKNKKVCVKDGCGQEIARGVTMYMS